MNNKELKKLNRRDLLELVLIQTKKIEELEKELEVKTHELNSKKTNIEESGSIAEAILKINKVFENAQEVAEQYIKAVKENTKEIEDKMMQEYEVEKNKMLKKVERECQERRNEVDNYICEVEQKLKTLLKGNHKIVTNINIDSRENIIL